MVGSMHGGGGHVWQGACVVGGEACMPGGVKQGACVVGSVEGVHGRGYLACMHVLPPPQQTV